MTKWPTKARRDLARRPGLLARALALGAASDANSGLLAGVNDSSRQGGLAIGVAGFGALVPTAAALGHGPAHAYVNGLHHALVLGAALAAAETA